MGFIDFFKDVGNAVVDGAEWVADTAEDGYDWVKGAAEDAWEWTEDAGEWLVDEDGFRQWIADTADDAAGVAEDIVYDGVDFANDGAQWVEQAVEDTADYFEDDFVDDLEEVATETIPDALQVGAQGIIDGANLLGDQVDKIPYVGPAITEWVGQIYDGGEDLVDGMFSGDWSKMGSGAWDMLGNMVAIPKTPISLKMLVQGADFVADISGFTDVLNKATGTTAISDFLDKAATHRGFIEMDDGNVVTKEDGEWPIYDVDDAVLGDGKRRAPVRVLKADDGSIYAIYKDGSHEQIKDADKSDPQPTPQPKPQPPREPKPRRSPEPEPFDPRNIDYSQLSSARMDTHGNIQVMRKRPASKPTGSRKR